MIEVEVAYALPDRQEIVSLRVTEGTTAYSAAEHSAINRLFEEVNLETVAMGVFGTVIPDPKNYVLKAGDRVEIYRPLLIDPKEARLRRAKKKV